MAVDAAFAANRPHSFLGATTSGLAAIINTTGNPYAHVILRGGNAGPNYDAESINKTVELLHSKHLSPYLVVDCSHGNSCKDHRRQKDVINSVCEYITHDKNNLGIMLESNLVAGNQPLTGDISQLTYGKSITDACIDWAETEVLLRQLADCVRKNHGNKS